jgi:hypothetical protein
MTWNAAPPEFKQKMAEVSCVYREVKLIKETATAAKQEPSNAGGDHRMTSYAATGIAHVMPDGEPCRVSLGIGSSSIRSGLIGSA